MSLQSLTPSLPALREAYPTPRPGENPRRQKAQHEAELAPPEEFSPPAEPEPFAAIVRTDLTGLVDPEPRPVQLTEDAVSSANAFLGAFSMLLLAVGAGDAGAARDAAMALQLELFGGPGALAAANESGDEAQARMLDDLLSLIRFARLGEIGPAEASALLLARHLQTALLTPARTAAPVERRSGRGRAVRAIAREPASLVQGATAAYEMLMDLDAGANAA